MSIGIMDADISTYTLVPYNLEAMKISAYYKKKNEIVVLTPEFTPERHKQYFFRKDYEDGNYPLSLNQPNVQYGGLAFSNNIYQPLPPEIEKMRPDTSLYDKLESVIRGVTPSKARDKIFFNMQRAEHCRLSLDGKTIWPDYACQFKFLKNARDIMFHDFNLNAIEGGFEEVQRILARARTDGWATKVGMKFPVQVDNGADLLKWSSLNTNSTFYSLRYDGVIDDDAFIEWVGRCRQKAVFTQMEYHITAARYDPNDFVMNLLPKILRQIIISRSYYVFFSLKYDEGFFPDRRWEDVIRLFNYYHNSYSGHTQSKFLLRVIDDTMYDFVSNAMKDPYYWYGDDIFTIEELRDIFRFVQDKNYDLFKDFYECSAKSLGGKL